MKLRAPKGHNSTAQGNALGTGMRCTRAALKGRNNRVEPGLFRPYRASAARTASGTQGVALGYRIAPLRGKRELSRSGTPCLTIPWKVRLTEDDSQQLVRRGRGEKEMDVTRKDPFSSG